ncbi:hypothetical protein FUSO3_11535, partial [Fusobacterium necrophorum BL]
ENHDLISAAGNVTLTAENKVENKEGKTIYAGNHLGIRGKEILNTKGELFSGGDISLTGNLVKNEIGFIQAEKNIHIKAKKFENIGEVKDLDKYESYYETWDGKTIEADQLEDWKIHFSKSSSKASNGSAGSTIRRRQREAYNEISERMKNDKYDSLLFSKYNKLMRGYLGKSGKHTEQTGSVKIPIIPLKEKLRSLAQTTHAKVIAGNNITIEAENDGKTEEVMNKDSIISAGNTVKINAEKVKNVVSVGDEKIKVKTGQETMYIKYDRRRRKHRLSKLSMEVSYDRDFTKDYITKRIPKLDENGDPVYKRKLNGRKVPVYESVTEYVGRYAYVTGQPSVIEGKHVILDSTVIIPQSIEEANGFIKNGISKNQLEEKTVDISKGIEKTNSNLSINSNTPIETLQNQTYHIDSYKPLSKKDEKLEIYANVKKMEDVIQSGVININSAFPSALFIKNVDPSSKYIMETRDKYINLNHFYGSDYFLKRMGHEETWDRVKRLGDAFYENQLIDRNVTEKLGTRLLNGKALSMKDLIDNASVEVKKLNLTIGNPLTKEQISKLNKDIVWYEYQEINGEKVLAPKVYLSQNTLANLNTDSRSKIGGTELTYIKTKDLINNGAKIGKTGITYVEANSVTNKTLTDQLSEIAGTKTYLTTNEDIKNISGKIFGNERVSIFSKNGNIINESKSGYDFSRKNREIDVIGEISSKKQVEILGKNYISTGAMLIGKDINLEMSENIHLNSLRLSGKELIIRSNENIATYGRTSGGIRGDNITLAAKKDINTTGVEIRAINNLSMLADHIRIETVLLDNERVITNDKKVNLYGINRAELQGNKVHLEARKNMSIYGANIKATDDLNMAANSINMGVVEVEQTDKIGGGRNYTIINTKRNIKNELGSGNHLTISTISDLNIKSTDIIAEKNIKIVSGGNIDVVSSTDSDYDERHSYSKRKWRGSKSSHTINYETKNVASNIIGDKVNITSGKNISLLGSHVQANTEGNIVADGNITQAGVKDIHYSYHKTTKTGFMGLTSKSVTDENYQEKAIVSATLSGDKGLTYDSKNNLILSGVKVVSGGSIDLKGKNVTINPLETKSYHKHEEVKKGFSGSFSPKGISVSYGKDKFSSDTDIVNQTASQIVSNKDINIEATEKVKAKSVDIYAKKDVNISGENGVEISTANNRYDNTTKQSSSRIGASVGINSAIVNTVENVKDIKNVTNFSGNHYDILNNASKVVGAIKDGAKATIAVADTNYNGATDAGYDNLKIMNDVFKANISYNKSESKSSVQNETVEKSSLVSGNNMNIKSKNGSITISGTDVKVGNDFNLSAKKDITMKASEENFTSSNSSSQMGIGLSADVRKGKIADLSISKAGTKGRGNGTNYVNSTVNVGGNLKTESENLILSGANVEADKFNIKAKNVVIESKQDKSERKDSSYGGSFSIDLANPSNFSATMNGRKGNGEKDWVNKQSTFIARNGGEVDTDNLTNIGAVIGSENETEKLKISVNKVVVKDLEDKNQYENIGGGITIGTDVPNVSVKHDKVDKEQINRATALNTDISLRGKEVNAEDLGFNTDITKAQEVTKDEEKHVDVELHTDLIGEDKQEELKKAGGILGDIRTAFTSADKTRGDFLERYKQASMMRAIGEQVEKNPEYLSILEKEARKNGKIDDKTQVEQVSVMNKLLNDVLRAKGYVGPEIKMVLTDVTDPIGPYYTDTLTNTVVLDRNTLANANRDEILNALGHEFGHYSKEDDIDKSQEIANHTGELLEDRTKGMVGKEASEETLAAIRNNRNVITGEEGKKLAESIPMERREYVKWGRVAKGTAITFLGGFRTAVGIGEVGLGAASSSVGVGVLVAGHGVAQTGFGISDMGEGIHDIYLGFQDIDDEEQQAVRISKKVLGKYEEPLNFTVGATTNQVIVLGQAFYRFPRMSNMAGNTNSSTKKESNSNVTTEKEVIIVVQKEL